MSDDLTVEAIAGLIDQRLAESETALRAQFESSRDTIGYFVVDDLLPESLVRSVYAEFPRPEQLTYNTTLRERKYITAQMDRFSPLVEKLLFAFQDPRIVARMAAICGFEHLQADDSLYAGGISVMNQGCYLNPHLDNSHDKDRRLWRALNLLYYVTPDWEEANGGNLELWPQGVGGPQLTQVSRCNRLVVMATHSRSWHSVSPVIADGTRCCVSNYFFSELPPEPTAKFHVTRFRARPGHPVADLALRLDGQLRMWLRKIRRQGVRQVTHLYQRDQ